MPPQSSTSSPHRSIETVSTWALFATLIAAIFIFIPSGSVPFGATKTFVLAAGALITLALYILARLGRGNVILPPLALVGALWLPVVAYALSTAFSGTLFANSLWGSSLEPDTLGFILVATLLGTLAALIVRRPEHYRSFLAAGAWAFGLLVAAQILVIIIGQYAPSAISPSFSIIGTYAELAILLGLGVIGILLTLREMTLPQRAYYASIAALTGALFLLAIANSPLVWTLVALVALGLFVEAIMQRRSKANDADLGDMTVLDEAPIDAGEGNRSIIAPLCVLAVALFFFLGGTLSTALADKLNVNILNVRPSWASTLAVGQKVYSTAPVFGSGPGTFGIEWLKHRDTSLNSTVFWNVDFGAGFGFIPTSFVTTGLIGLCAWAVLLALFLWYGLRMITFRAPQDAFVRHVALLSFVASAYLFVVATLDLPGAIGLALLFVFVGLFVSTTRFAAGGEQWGVIFARSPRLGFIIVFTLTIVLLGTIAAGYTLVERYVATMELAKAQTALASGNLDAADAAAKNSVFFAPSVAAYQIEAGVAGTRLDSVISSTTLSPAEAQKAFQDALSAGINAALTTTRLAPSSYQSWVILGNLYAKAVPLSISGAYDSAKSAYEKARQLNPTSPQIPFILAQLEIANRNMKAAKEHLKEAISLKQDYTQAIFLLSQLEVRDGNVREALAAALAAAYFTPNDPSILFQVGVLSAAQGDLVSAGNALSAAVAANPQFANARYLLSAIYAKRGDLQNALVQLQAVADMSAANAEAVAKELSTLQSGKNPFPADLLSIPAAPIGQ